MKIRPYYKSELAQAYAPDISQGAALNRLALWIKTNRQLTEALRQTDYRVTQRMYTSRQVALIFEGFKKNALTFQVKRQGVLAQMSRRFCSGIFWASQLLLSHCGSSSGRSGVLPSTMGLKRLLCVLKRKEATPG